MNWWHFSWNPVSGCRYISLGCLFCYAAFEAATRQAFLSIPLYRGITKWVRGLPFFNGKSRVLPPSHPGWDDPLKHPGSNLLCFVVDMADLFLEDRPKEHIQRVIARLLASKHIGLLLTKRPARMNEIFSKPMPENARRHWQKKLYLGISAETQKDLDARWAHMRPLAEAGWTVFVSIAPMLGPIILPPDFLALASWVIVSGTQRTVARLALPRLDPAWARNLRDQCASAQLPFFMLQMTGNEAIPDDLDIHEFPKVWEGVRDG